MELEVDRCFALSSTASTFSGDSVPVSLGFTGFYWVLLGLTAPDGRTASAAATTKTDHRCAGVPFSFHFGSSAVCSAHVAVRGGLDWKEKFPFFFCLRRRLRRPVKSRKRRRRCEGNNERRNEKGKKRRRFRYRKRSRENGGANRTRRRRTCGIGGHPTFTEQNKNDSEPSTTSMWIRLSPSESQKRERGKKRKTMDSNAAKSSTKDKAKIQPNEQRENHSLKIDGRTS